MKFVCGTNYPKKKGFVVILMRISEVKIEMNKKGELFKIIQPLGYDHDEETIRLIKIMTKMAT